ncbi:MAG: glycosyltransferase family 4 protein [Chitinophagaceae bacterium]|nr:glycosyltransferase family 4 protein [Chitinophagaceae bacterium]
MMSKKKVLILQEEMPEYRVPIFNMLADKVDLTVAFFRPIKLENKIHFNTVTLKSHQLGRYFYLPGLRNFCKGYDVVYYAPHLKVFNFFLLTFYNNKFKTIAWTNGTRASYTQMFDLNRRMGFLDKLYFMNIRRADAIILYIKEALETVTRNGVDKKRVFVAHNTVVVNYEESPESDRNTILFVGTLYKGKGVDELIKCYHEAYQGQDESIIPSLEIVGKGAERESLENSVKELGLSGKVKFHGGIYDEGVLAKIFRRSILCISPNQAGLSVLKSLGYGVPFVTKGNAITGGEIVNVLDKYNGILYQEADDLTALLKDLIIDKSKYIQMGKNAREYYLTQASPERMVGGFLDALNFVTGEVASKELTETAM